MEYLRILTDAGLEEDLLKLIREFEIEMEKDPGLLAWQVFRHATVKGDFLVQLHWRTSRVIPEGSTLAYCLIKNLSRIGLVNHGVWVEEGNT